MNPCPPSSSNHARLDKSRLQPSQFVSGNVAGDTVIGLEALHRRRRLVADRPDAAGTAGRERTAAGNLVGARHSPLEHDACGGANTRSTGPSSATVPRYITATVSAR